METWTRKKFEQLIRKNGWYKVRSTDDHDHFKHPHKWGMITLVAGRKEINPTIARRLIKEYDLRR